MDPMLKELWKVKDDIAREASYDVHRFFENLRKWEAEHPHSGLVVHNAEELRQLVEKREREHAAESSLILNDKPPRKA